MLPRSLHEIRCHAHIQSTVATVCKQVYAKGLFHSELTPLLLSFLRTHYTVIPRKHYTRHSRESGNPVSFVRTPLDPRFRGDDDRFMNERRVHANTPCMNHCPPRSR